MKSAIEGVIGRKGVVYHVVRNLQTIAATVAVTLVANEIYGS